MIRFRWVLVGVLLFAVAGCSNRTFVGQQYANFTAYYNKFYNAQKAFEEGVRTVERPNEVVDRNRYLPLFVPTGSAPDPTPFDRAIKKSSDVLREHARSKWVDDALLLIGKSYFYQRNYVGAEQKFREVIALGSELEGEARFWLGRVLVAAENYAAAAEHLQSSLSSLEPDETWTAMTNLALGELRVHQEMWSEAAAALQRGLEGDIESATEAKASFLLGQVLETLGNYEGAVRAYERAADQNPRYELSYAAQVSALRVQGLHLDAEEALANLRDMEGDDKNFDKRQELALLRGRLYKTLDRPREARRVYEGLLYDEDERATGQLLGRTHYALAALYRDAYRDFSTAAAHFDTASSSLSRGDNGEDGLAPAAVQDSRQQASVFGVVAERASAVSRMDSLLRIGQMDDESFRAFVADLQEQRAENRAAQRAARKRQQASQRFGRNQAPVGGRTATPQSEATTTAGSESGFLFHKDPARAQEARQAFQRQWGGRPRVPNWRRRAAISQRIASREDIDAPAEQANPSMSGAGGAAASLVDVSAVPRDSASRAQMRADRALARYELGNALFLSIGRPDSAAAWYRRVIEEDSTHPVARRALYALAEAHTAMGDSTEARRLYRRVVEHYPHSAFAERAQDRLSNQAPRPQTVQVADSTALAGEAYNKAYAQWQQGNRTDALEQMVRVADRYPQTDIAPRALLAAGTIYMEQLRADSIRAETALPEVFASVLARRDTTRSLPDTVRTQPEATPADSLWSGGSAVDSLRADSMQAPVDSAAAAAVWAALPDSLQLLETIPASSPSMAATGGPAALSMEHLFSHIVERYPDSKQAERANRVLAAWSEPADTASAGPAPVDTMTAPPPDTSAAGPGAREPAAEPGGAPAIERRAGAPADTAAARPSVVDTAAVDTARTVSPDTSAGEEAALPAPTPPPAKRSRPDLDPDSTTAPPDSAGTAPVPDTTATERERRE